ncbi:MAG TPA: TIM barrel protein [Ktedonobacteraceae bacterium]|nr:TIM barrel protein [Ktedonobacteraceae bacterium]
MIHLSAFADEISADLNEQIEVIRSEHIHYIDLRGAWNTNVLDLTDQQVTEIKQRLDAQGIGVSAIASPIGKTPIDTPFEEHLQRFQRAIELAQFFHTPFIRIFSFYSPISEGKGIGGKESVDPAIWRNEVLRRLRELTRLARNANLVLLHENEKDIYGDTIARCIDLLQNINDPHFQAIFDPANFIQCGQTPYPDAYQAMRPWLRYMHVKDALADGTVVAAGGGMARWLETLQQLHADSYDGFFSLEPHLALAGQFQGFSGPELFHKASQSLQQLLQSIDWKYA